MPNNPMQENVESLNSNHLDGCVCFECMRRSKPWDGNDWDSMWKTYRNVSCRNCGQTSGKHHFNKGQNWAGRCRATGLTKLTKIRDQHDTTRAAASWYEPVEC